MDKADVANVKVNSCHISCHTSLKKRFFVRKKHAISENLIHEKTD